ncbi:MAG: hypothetical protein K5989_07625 [Lachnospiraceae bacterium]|nr:hypothetical protein [Lachnospiraceae bacterium]
MDKNSNDARGSGNSRGGGKPSFTDKVKYWFDNIMTKGMVAKIGLLIGFTVICVFLAGFIISLVFRQKDVGGSVWDSFLHVLDAGTIAGDQGGISFLLVMLILTVFGLLFMGTLIGLLNNGIEAKMERLAQGKSRVLEQGHTVVLGYNDVTVSLLSELMEANSNQRLVPVVVMDSMETVEMESEVRNRLVVDKHTKLIFRTGEIYNFDDLDICNLRECKSIIINAENDFDTIKAILACKGKLDQIAEEEENPRKVYITAVIRDEKNEIEAKLAGGDRLKLIVYSRIMAKIMAGAGRQPGLSYVYSELFSYEDNEIYCEHIKPENSLTDSVKMYDINHYVENAVILGGIPKVPLSEISGSAANSIDEDIKCYSFPVFPETMEFKDFDKFFILEEDDGSMKLLPSSKSGHVIKEEQINMDSVLEIEPVKIMIIGVSPMLKQVLYELDGYYNDLNVRAEVILSHDECIDINNYYLKGQEKFNALDITIIDNVDIYRLEVLERVLDDTVTNIMLLTEDKGMSSKEDERILMQLIYLRDIRERNGYEFNICCEMNLESNTQLAKLTGQSDFVVGSNLTAMIMTQISECTELYEFFDELLRTEGSEIYMRKAKTYLNFTDQTIKTDFYTMAEAAARRHEILIGIQKLKNRDPECRRCEYEVPVLNPVRWETGNGTEMQLVEFELLPDDLLVVLAEN